MLGTFADFLEENRENIEEARPRMLWAPDPLDASSLICTDFRWIVPDLEAGPLSNTVYSLVDKGSGPPGRAYHMKGPLVRQKLPSYPSDPDSCVDILLHEFGIDTDLPVISGRKAQGLRLLGNSHR